jgi:DNA mismatch endonuclease (patch repair protein)
MDVKLPGRPDIAFMGKKVAVFVDGCFWHGCPNHGRIPSDKIGYWAAKIQRNKDRDERVNIELSRMGWVVLRFWEHELKQNIEDIAAVIRTTVA